MANANVLRKSIEVGGRVLTLETGRMAKQASGAVLLLTEILLFWLQQLLHQNPGKELTFFL